MDITRVAAISPVLRINGFKSKDAKTDAKSKEEKKGKDFAKELKSKQWEVGIQELKQLKQWNGGLNAKKWILESKLKPWRKLINFMAFFY